MFSPSCEEICPCNQRKMTPATKPPARAEAPREAERAAAEERTAEQAALLAPLAATDTTASLAKRRRSALVAAVLHQPIAEPAGRAAQMLAPLGEQGLRKRLDTLRGVRRELQLFVERVRRLATHTHTFSKA